MNLSDGQLVYWPSFYASATAAAYFTQLAALLDWQSSQVRLFGRTIQEPRLTCWHSDAQVHYRYSGRQLKPKAWLPLLADIRSALAQVTQAPFNSMLGNYYRNGNDYMGWHSDDESSLGDQPVVASFSFGVERPFVLRRRDNHQHKHQIILNSGSLLLMRGQLQHYWQHALPKRRRITEPRINLTFRYVYPQAAV